jgi:type 1 glutamine amidotransferase
LHAQGNPSWRAAKTAWEPVAWVRPYGKGRVFDTSLNHSTPSQQNSSFLKMVTSAVRWAGAGKVRP